MGRRTYAYLPLQPLLDYYAEHFPHGEMTPGAPDPHELPKPVPWEVFGVSRSTWQAWHENEKGLREDTADRVAVYLGHHPVNIWTDWYALTGGN